jgi:hypothetical protein
MGTRREARDSEAVEATTSVEKEAEQEDET